VTFILRIREDWHVYADQPGMGGQSALRLITKLSPGVTVEQPWSWPAPKIQPRSGDHQYTGEQRFKCRVKTDPNAADPHVDLAVVYQACSEETCLLPATLRLTIPLTALTR